MTLAAAGWRSLARSFTLCRLMALRCGIVGLPNVGKSTLFNALTAASVPAENYPFCTIEPNAGVVAVPDARLAALDAIVHSARVIPATVELVDIAGLVRGASKGEGLGNQFLAHIRETSAIAMVLRCFEDPDVTHVDGSIDPLRDAETIETELALADLDTVERRARPRAALGQDAGQGGRGRAGGARAARGARPRTSRAARRHATLAVPDDARSAFRDLHLLTAKPVLFVANVDEAGLRESDARGARRALRRGARAPARVAPLREARGGARRARRRRRRRRSWRSSASRSRASTAWRAPPTRCST